MISLFLSIILVTVTITALSSSFMTNAEAQPSYYYDGIGNRYYNYEPTPEYHSYGKSNYESKESSSSLNLKKIKCNYINININGIELNITSFSFLSGIADDDAEAS